MVRVMRAMVVMVFLVCVIAVKAEAEQVTALAQPIKEAEVTALEVATPSAPVDYSPIASTLADSFDPLAENKGSTKESGRCIAFANDTGTYKLTLRVFVYAEEDEGYLSRGWRLTRSLGGEQQVMTREYQLDPGELISFNQKPRIEVGSLAKGAAGTALLGLPGLVIGGAKTPLGTGEYTYLAGLGIAGIDMQTGESIFAGDEGDGLMRALGTASEGDNENDFVMINPEELKKINNFIQNLNDHEACKESEAQKTSALIAIRRKSPPDALKDILDSDDSKQGEFLANVDDDLTIVVPFRNEKGFLDRLTLHMTQNPNSFKAIKNAAMTAIALARLSAGDASAAALLTSSLAGLGDSALTAVKNQIGYGESATQIDQLATLVKSASGIGEAMGGLDKLLGIGGGALDAIAGATKSDYLKGAAETLKANQGNIKAALALVSGGDKKKASEVLADAAKKYFTQARELDEQKLEDWEVLDKDALQLVAAREGEAVLKLKEFVDSESGSALVETDAKTGFDAVLQELLERQSKSGDVDGFEWVESPEVSGDYVEVRSPVISPEYVEVESPTISDDYVKVNRPGKAESLTFAQELEQAVQKRRQVAGPEYAVGGEAASGARGVSAEVAMPQESFEQDYVMVEKPSLNEDDYQAIERFVERDLNDDYGWIGRESEAPQSAAKRARAGVQLFPEQVQREFEQQYVPQVEPVETEEPATEDEDFVELGDAVDIPSEGNQGGGFFQRLGGFFGLW